MNATETTTAEPKSYQTLQLWPGGTIVHYAGDPDCEGMLIRAAAPMTPDNSPNPFRAATTEERRAVRDELTAARLLDREVLCCDSMLAPDLMRFGVESRGAVGQEFELENVTNLTPDPSFWDIDECKEWLDEHGYDHPDGEHVRFWRDAVRDLAEPAEIYEWWRVSEWLGEKLKEVGEPVLDNAYGCWWGRTCTGQGILMDGTLQKVAALLG